jgi:hypothetical protein
MNNKNLYRLEIATICLILTVASCEIASADSLIRIESPELEKIITGNSLVRRRGNLNRPIMENFFRDKKWFQSGLKLDLFGHWDISENTVCIYLFNTVSCRFLFKDETGRLFFSNSSRGDNGMAFDLIVR